MFLKEFLGKRPKADLQSYHLCWLPDDGMVSAKDKLASVLQKCMSDQDLVRKRFEGLGGSQKAFLVSLLRRDGYQGTLGEVRSGQHGGQIARGEPYQGIGRIQGRDHDLADFALRYRSGA